MSTQKCTLLFNYASNSGEESGVNTLTNAITRTAGWSESWYLVNLSADEVRARTVNLAQVRAALLPIGCAVVGQRYQTVDPVGPSQTGSVVFPGTAGTLADVPQMSLFYRLPASTGRNIRPVVLRGLPDARSVRGEYLPSDKYDKALASFFGVLRGQAFCFRGRDLSKPELPIVAVIGHTVSTQDAHGFTEGQMVRILRTVDDDSGRKMGGVFQVRTPITTRQFDIYPDNNWDTRGGRVRLEAAAYFTIGVEGTPRVMVRKAGRAFFGYRGRQSNRR